MTTTPTLVESIEATETSFARWYNGNYFKPDATWATDGRLMVRLDAVRTKSARAKLLKPSRDRVPYADGDAKVANVLGGPTGTRSLVPATVVGPVVLRTIESLPRKARQNQLEYLPHLRTRMVVSPVPIDRKRVTVFERVALDFMLANVRHDALAIDPRGGVWLTLDGAPVALLMPITIPDKEHHAAIDALVTAHFGAEVKP